MKKIKNKIKSRNPFYKELARAYILLINKFNPVFFPTARHTRVLTVATFFRRYFSPTLLMARWRIIRPYNNTGVTRKIAALTIT
jgi:hypothetical protein